MRGKGLGPDVRRKGEGGEDMELGGEERGGGRMERGERREERKRRKEMTEEGYQKGEGKRREDKERGGRREEGERRCENWLRSSARAHARTRVCACLCGGCAVSVSAECIRFARFARSRACVVKMVETNCLL